VWTKRKTEITVETRQVLTISLGKRFASAWCEGCSGQATMISAEQAAVLAGVRSRTLHRWAHARAIHFTERPEGRLLICLRSLMMYGGETNKVDK
jgi:hypothetical protein